MCRLLACAHFVLAIPLVLMAGFFGLLLAPFFMAAPVWLAILGIRLWNPKTLLAPILRPSHAAYLALGALLVGLGGFTLHAASRSAAHGGGLLGAWGFIPLVLGFLLAALSSATLALASVARNAAQPVAAPDAEPAS